MKNKRNFRIIFPLAMMLFFGCVEASVCRAQDLEKSILSEDFIVKKRPARKISRPKPALPPSPQTKKRTYKLVRRLKTPRRPAPQYQEAMLGLTVWKMRPASEKDEVKELMEEAAGCKVTQPEYTWARNESETPLEVCDLIRLSVESLSHSGYLYVVDRELYGDGTYGAPKLVYPTLLSAGASNPISPGDSIFVPESGAKFRVKAEQNEKTQVAEVLTVIISPKQLFERSALKTKAINLPPQQFADWLKRWEVETVLLEQEDGAGEPITQIEQTASEAAKGLTEESSLSQTDPAPQSIFRALIKKGDPFLVNVFLKFRAK